MWQIYSFQYSDDVGELNETARHRPHTALVAGIKQENRHLRDLQQENRELKAALEEQQNALELIMTKYRQQMTKLVNNSKMDFPKLYSQRNNEVCNIFIFILTQPIVWKANIVSRICFARNEVDLFSIYEVHLECALGAGVSAGVKFLSFWELESRFFFNMQLYCGQ